MPEYEYRRRGGFLSSWPPAVKAIIIINVLVFIMYMLNKEFMIMHFALFYPSSSEVFHLIYPPSEPMPFKLWQLVTHMFMHGGFWHILFNMYTLFIFGCVLERVWGWKKFLLFYFVTGLGAAACHLGVQWIEIKIYLAQLAQGSLGAKEAIASIISTPTVGASGAIYGLLLGYGMLYPDSRLTLLFPPISMKAKWFVLIFAGIELLTGMTGLGGNIAHFAHLGGMLFGWLLILYWKRKHTLYEYHG